MAPLQVGRSPQDKALQASAHLRTPPASVKKALRFPSPARVPALGRHGQAQQAAAAAAQATSRVISGFGQVAARLGMSGFFGGAPAGSKAAGTQKAHTAAAADASLRAGNLLYCHIVLDNPSSGASQALCSCIESGHLSRAADGSHLDLCHADAKLGVPKEKAKGAPQDSSGRQAASLSQPSLLKASAAVHAAASNRPGQDDKGSREPEILHRHAPARHGGHISASTQQSKASLRTSSTHAHAGAADGSQASLSQHEHRHSAPALPIGSEKAHQAGTYTERPLSAAAGTGQVTGQLEGSSSPSDEGAAPQSGPTAMPGMSIDTGEHAISKVATISPSSAQSGQCLMICALGDEPSSISDHAVSEMSGESAGDREHGDSSWPAGTAQHSMAASKATHARCDELRSSGGSVGKLPHRQ